MPTVNVILQLYLGGWREQTATAITDNLRIEAALGSGAIKSEAEARRVATGQFNMYATPITSRTVAVEPVDFSDTPWLSHVPGNTITLDADQELVESLAFRRDQDGHIDYAAELNSHVDTPEERRDLALKKMSNGTFGGTSRPAQPFNTTPPPDILGPLNLCCNWGFTGVGSDPTVAADTTVEIPVESPISTVGGDLYIPPDNALLPIGLWTIQGTVTLTFDAPATGPCVVFQQPPNKQSGFDPASEGGRVEGRGYANGDPELSFRFGGVYLLGVAWVPSVVVLNSTDQGAAVSVTLEAFGTSCSCRMATTPGGG